MNPAERKIGIVVLAAGRSSRMGAPKQLLPFGGKTLLRLAAETAIAAGCRPVIVVLGSRAADMASELNDLDIQVVDNLEWEAGMGSSIRAGITVAEQQGCDGVVLALADQPFVSPEFLIRLVQENEWSSKPIVASSYGGSVGVPAFFSREFFPQLMALDPSQGCKPLILSNKESSFLVPCPEAEMDIDTPEDYLRLQPPD